MEKKITLWAARDRDGVICLFDKEPKRDIYYGMFVRADINSYCEVAECYGNVFDDITFEKSPVEIEMIIKIKELNYETILERYCGRSSVVDSVDYLHKYSFRENVYMGISYCMRIVYGGNRHCALGFKEIKTMVVAIIFLMIGIVLLAFGVSFDSHQTSALGGLFIGEFFAFLEPTKLSAIDVYRNKTTLEITYRDSIAVDSVVVFKTK